MATKDMILFKDILYRHQLQIFANVQNIVPLAHAHDLRLRQMSLEPSSVNVLPTEEPEQSKTYASHPFHSNWHVPALFRLYERPLYGHQHLLSPHRLANAPSHRSSFSCWEEGYKDGAQYCG